MIVLNVLLKFILQNQLSLKSYSSRCYISTSRFDANKVRDGVEAVDRDGEENKSECGVAPYLEISSSDPKEARSELVD